MAARTRTIVALVALVVAGCNAASGKKGSNEDTLPAKLPNSTKSYELFSWEVDGTWRFTLITGTNRNKTADEITAEKNTISDDGFVKITVDSEEALLGLLSRLPPESSLFWCTSDSPNVQGSTLFAFPDEDRVERIEAFCQERDIKLSR
jgi:hypothetical protein